MVSFFSIRVQDWLSTNNDKLLNPFFFPHTNFIFLILLTHCSLTSSPSVLLQFFFFNMVCVWLYLPYHYAQDSFSKWFGALSFGVILPFEYIHSHPSPLSMSVHYTMWSLKKWTPQEEDMQVCLSIAFLCYFFLFI